MSVLEVASSRSGTNLTGTPVSSGARDDGHADSTVDLRRHDGSILSGSKPGEMASGAHHLVLKRLLTPSTIFPGYQPYNADFLVAV